MKVGKPCDVYQKDQCHFSLLTKNPNQPMVIIFCLSLTKVYNSEDKQENIQITNVFINMMNEA